VVATGAVNPAAFATGALARTHATLIAPMTQSRRNCSLIGFSPFLYGPALPTYFRQASVAPVIHCRQSCRQREYDGDPIRTQANPLEF
jgi:urea transporter